LGPMAGGLGMGVVRTLSIMPYSMASLGSIHLLRDNSRMTWHHQDNEQQQDTSSSSSSSSSS
jgi:hypothetical protein